MHARFVISWNLDIHLNRFIYFFFNLLKLFFICQNFKLDHSFLTRWISLYCRREYVLEYMSQCCMIFKLIHSNWHFYWFSWILVNCVIFFQFFNLILQSTDSARFYHHHIIVCAINLFYCLIFFFVMLNLLFERNTASYIKGYDFSPSSRLFPSLGEFWRVLGCIKLTWSLYLQTGRIGFRTSLSRHALLRIWHQHLEHWYQAGFTVSSCTTWYGTYRTIPIKN